MWIQAIYDRPLTESFLNLVQKDGSLVDVKAVNFIVEECWKHDRVYDLNPILSCSHCSAVEVYFDEFSSLISSDGLIFYS